jgi:hypothetical protein
MVGATIIIESTMHKTLQIDVKVEISAIRYGKLARCVRGISARSGNGPDLRLVEWRMQDLPG